MTRLLLQPRDLNALVCIYKHGFLLRDDVRSLCFPSSTRRLTARRIKRLVDANLLEGSVLPLGAFPIGLTGLLTHPGQFAYRVTEAGAHLIAEATETDIAQVRRRIQAAPSYVGHAVAVAKIAVAFDSFAAPQGYLAEDFLCEGDARYRYRWRPTGSDWKTEELRPDGLICLQRGEESFQVHLEADMATQGKTALEGKLSAYARYARTGALRQRFPGEATLHLGVVTTSPDRARVIVKALAALDDPALSGALVTTFAQLADQGPLAPIWSSHITLDLKGLLPCSA